MATVTGNPSIDIRIRGAKQIRELDRRLLLAARYGLRKKLRDQLKRSGRPVLRDTKRAVMRVKVVGIPNSDKPPRPKSRRNPRSLRQHIRNNLQLSYNTRGAAHVRFQVKRDAFKWNEHGLPKYLDGTLRGGYNRWRHPIFEDRDAPKRGWAQQRGQPWFFVTINRHKKEMRDDLLDAMKELAKEIEGR